MYSTDSVICFMNSLWRRDFLDRVAGLHAPYGTCTCSVAIRLQRVNARQYPSSLNYKCDLYACYSIFNTVPANETALNSSAGCWLEGCFLHYSFPWHIMLSFIVKFLANNRPIGLTVGLIVSVGAAPCRALFSCDRRLDHCSISTTTWQEKR